MLHNLYPPTYEMYIEKRNKIKETTGKTEKDLTPFDGLEDQERPPGEFQKNLAVFLTSREAGEQPDKYYIAEYELNATLTPEELAARNKATGNSGVKRWNFDHKTADILSKNDRKDDAKKLLARYEGMECPQPKRVRKRKN